MSQKPIKKLKIKQNNKTFNKPILKIGDNLAHVKNVYIIIIGNISCTAFILCFKFQ